MVQVDPSKRLTPPPYVPNPRRPDPGEPRLPMPTGTAATASGDTLSQLVRMLASGIAPTQQASLYRLPPRQV